MFTHYAGILSVYTIVAHGLFVLMLYVIECDRRFTSIFSKTFIAYCTHHHVLVSGDSVEMVFYKERGHCGEGWIGSDTNQDLQSCLDICIADDQCLFVSHWKDRVCAKYSSPDCKFTRTELVTSYKYTTYRKYHKGTCIIIKYFPELSSFAMII